MPIDFLTDFEPEYSRAVPVTPLVRRVVCDNPGRFTFAGTGTYIVGRGQVAVIDPGPDDEDHLAALLAAVAGEEVTAELLERAISSEELTTWARGIDAGELILVPHHPQDPLQPVD